jgi:hypothetical protein
MIDDFQMTEKFHMADFLQKNSTFFGKNILPVVKCQNGGKISKNSLQYTWFFLQKICHIECFGHFEFLRENDCFCKRWTNS